VTGALPEVGNLGLLNLLTDLYLPACYQHYIKVMLLEELREKIVLIPSSPEKFSTEYYNKGSAKKPGLSWQK